MNKKYLLTWLALLAFTPILSAGVGDWITFTSQNDVRDIAVIDDKVWCATNGGVFHYEIQTGEFYQFNNTNGLSSVDARAIKEDNAGTIWLGFGDGALNAFDPATGQWTEVNDYKGYFIFDIETYGDSLLIALDIGISLYDIRKSEVKETYKNLGWKQADGSPAVDIAVTGIVIVGRDIWALCELGVVKSSFDLANLMAPESWTNYTTEQGLPSTTMKSIQVHEGSVFIATDSGVAVFRNGSWVTINSNLPALNIIDLSSNGTKLMAASQSQVVEWNSTSEMWQVIGAKISTISCLFVTGQDDIWVGRKKGGSSKGFAHYVSETGVWQELVAPGPPGNEFNCLAVDQEGILWCGSNSDGIFSFDGQTWRQFDTKAGLLSNRIKSVSIDSHNRKWFGTVGGGLALIDENDSLSVFYKEVLSGIAEDANFVLISDVKVDVYDNVWVLNSAAVNSNIIAVYTAARDWQYFAEQEGFLSMFVNTVSFDANHRVWIGSEEGVNVLDYNNTLFDKTDDDLSGTLQVVDGLEANVVKDLAVDSDNIVWISTSGGMNYWDPSTNPPSVKTQAGLLSNTINAIEVDIRNNKWFGTSEGVSLLASDGYTLTHYTTENSSLVNNNVTSFGFDAETGRVYIGTANGLSCLETPFSRPRENLDQVTFGPNPFMSNGNQEFIISNLADDVAIKFMTENGMVVRSLSNNEIFGSQASWDGKNDNDEFVRSGVYVFIIYNEETGLNRTGKVAVIH
ncbi:MAG: hypothetical protein ACOY90_07905 [Candidatus Zhuqueibacterota bacterium]